MYMKRLFIIPALVLFISACSNAPVQAPGSGHLRAEKVGAGDTVAIPAPVQQILTLPKPKAAAKIETYSVVVNNVRVQELLFALARDAKLNVDIHPGIGGVVTLNAIDQTLQQLLTRIAKQVDVRWELDGPNLAVMPDSPYLRNYKVDYVNMSRDVAGTVAINTQIASTSTAAGTGAGGGSGGGGNNSSTTVRSSAKNNFWESIEKNLKDILRETDKILPEGSSETVVERQDEQATTGTGSPQSATGARGVNAAQNLAASPNPAAFQQTGTTVTRRVTFREAASVIINPEAGVVVVRATSRQHEKVQEYLVQVLSSSRRQVMVEATIAEVNLSDQYQQGINWQRLRTGSSGFSIAQNPPNQILDTTTTATGLLLNYLSPGTGIASTLKLLETFGNVKVLSSPKTSVLNNQTAMLKVVDNIVYFTIKSDTTTNTSTTQTNVTATPNSVAVGLVMSVTPQIDESGTVLLNVRPTITRIKSSDRTQWVEDPTPNLGAKSYVPEIQTREMESMLRLTDGEIAVMGGLMSDELSNTTDAVPLLSQLPGIGTFFTSRNDIKKKTELVIFLKPTIIRDPSVSGDYRDFAQQLPNKDFFANNPGPQQQQIDLGGAKR
ncbi:MAG: pilus (MSHA type) biogenesis protein MshL [Gammaproteobacteria bacterium]|nr:pilus (MSHA type) biogenesis protein MshL [Rhodocyclaceae bacterium]MBU3908219.1 pilus (MSHA type) biogenesis protein MshL [Gammaproteobacteria bacterium]MBU4003144.1 pilus (MSHA type) biogenesis protein MshL [Gammaproteobacteria bacterium]MBU4019986.1 pilus (MSHA type) biogenesis protein MshL [Gammaproteobacteria bacterium]MBU4096848.1 pilus (MSHA type) biogenesis protein MshL [Gammaproteobacteria bacterium]